MAITLQQIFQTSFDAYASSHRMALKQHQAAQAILNCRTPAQGGHVQRCPDGHEAHIQYHSCRHRSCPQCNTLPKEQWLLKQRERLLPIDHYHLIFTLPHELLSFWRYNQHWMTHTMFRVISDTLLTLSKDSKHLGALPGFILSLHSWGRNLSLHPHIHCLFTGGGLQQDGGWCGVKNSFLFPSRVVRQLYRGKFMAAFGQGLRSGELIVPPHLSEKALTACIKQVYRKDWHVRVQPPYQHGQGVVMYLSRYVKGGPLASQRIVSADDKQVTFRFKDHRDGKNKTLTLNTPHFIERLLDHVAEPRQHVIRHFGLYGHQAKEKRQQCRAHLGLAPESDASSLSWDQFLQQFPNKDNGRCSTCGKPLVRAMGISKNSLYKVQGRGNVQPSVQPNIKTWQSAKQKPPNDLNYFFDSLMSVN